MNRCIQNNHITYEEIELFMTGDEEDFSEANRLFRQGFFDRVENCDVCSERYRTFTLVPAMMDIDIFAEGFEEEENPILLFAEAMLKKAGLKIKQFIDDNIFIGQYQQPALAYRGTGQTENPDAVVQPEDSITVSEDGVSREITVLKPAELHFKISAPDGKFKLYLKKATEGQPEETIYDFDKTRTKDEQAVITDILEAGVYEALVIEVDEND